MALKDPCTEGGGDPKSAGTPPQNKEGTLKNGLTPPQIKKGTPKEGGTPVWDVTPPPFVSVSLGPGGTAAP